MLRTEYKRLKLYAVSGLSACGILVVACLFLEPGWAASVDAAQVSAAGETSKDIYYQTEAVPVGSPAPSPRETIYPRYGTLDNRLIIWFVTQQHTYFGGFVLALPIFCLLIEVIGLMMRDREAASRYDRVARDFLQVSLLAFSMTAMAGAVMLGLFIATIATTSFLPYVSDLGMGFVAMTYAAIMLIRYKAEVDKFYRAIDWDLLGFFAALFVVINVTLFSTESRMRWPSRCARSRS